jgi:hypothetical protein
MIYYAILWAYKLRKIIKFINLKSTIRLATCLCTYAAALEFLYGVVCFKFKRKIQNLFEIPWKKLEKEKKKRFPFHSWLLPIGLAAFRFFPRLLSIVRSASRAVDGAHGPFPAPPWAEPATGPLSRAPTLSLSPLSLADVVGPCVRATSFLKPSATTLSKTITDQIPLNLFLPYLEHPRSI